MNVDFPALVVAGLDKQARHLGVTQQSLIKMWIAERLGSGKFLAILVDELLLYDVPKNMGVDEQICITFNFA